MPEKREPLDQFKWLLEKFKGTPAEAKLRSRADKYNELIKEIAKKREEQKQKSSQNPPA